MHAPSRKRNHSRRHDCQHGAALRHTALLQRDGATPRPPTKRSAKRARCLLPFSGIPSTSILFIWQSMRTERKEGNPEIWTKMNSLPPFAGWGHSHEAANSSDHYVHPIRGMQALAEARLHAWRCTASQCPPPPLSGMGPLAEPHKAECKRGDVCSSAARAHHPQFHYNRSFCERPKK